MLVNAYCTLEQVRDQLSDVDSRVSDAQLERAVNATSRAVDAWCGRRFWTDGTPVARTYRPRTPYTARVDDISTTDGLIVATDPGGDGTFGASWTIGTDYQLEPLNADANGGAYAWWDIVAVGSRWLPCSSTRRPTLRVTAAFGWSAVPEQVREATILKAVALFKRKDAPFGVANFNDYGAVRITRRDPDVIDLLSPFQRELVA